MTIFAACVPMVGQAFEGERARKQDGVRNSIRGVGGTRVGVANPRSRRSSKLAVERFKLERRFAVTFCLFPLSSMKMLKASEAVLKLCRE